MNRPPARRQSDDPNCLLVTLSCFAFATIGGLFIWRIAPRTFLSKLEGLFIWRIAPFTFLSKLEGLFIWCIAQVTFRSKLEGLFIWRIAQVTFRSKLEELFIWRIAPVTFRSNWKGYLFGASPQSHFVRNGTDCSSAPYHIRVS